MSVVHLARTERHVEDALRSDRSASTIRSFTRALARSGPLRPASPEVTRLATALSLAEMRSDDAPGPSLVGPLDEALGALRRAGLRPSVLLRAAGAGAVGARAELLARLLEDTDARLARSGLYDERATGWLAAEAVARARPDELPERVVIEGLLDWQPADFAWVEALAARVVTQVRLPHFAVGGREAYGDDALLGLVESRWQAQSDAPDLELEEAPLPAPELVVEGASPEAECRAIVRAVHRALADGADAERIAVALPSLDEEFLEPLRAMFEEARIPFVEPRGRPSVAVPAARAALGWLELAIGPLHRDAIVDLLQSGAVDPRGWIDAGSERSARERALSLARRLAQIPVGADPDASMLLAALAAWGRERPAEAWMEAALTKMTADLLPLSRGGTRARIADELRARWRGMGLGETPARLLRALVTEHEMDGDAMVLAKSLRERAAAMRTLDLALERTCEAAALLGASLTEVSPRLFRTELEAALAGAPPEGGTPRSAAVQIARTSEIAGRQLALLVVARTSEGTFGEGLGGGLLDDDLVRALPRPSRPHTSRSLAATRRAELAWAMSRAARLVVTRSTADAEGRPDPPAQLFTLLAESGRLEREPASVVARATPAVSAHQAELRAIAWTRKPADEDLARRAAIERARLAFFLDPDAPAGLVTGGIDGHDPTALAHLRRAFGGDADRPVPATSIERAADCRFAAFAARVLRASSSDESTEEVAPWQRGALVHRALHIAMETIRPFWGKLSPEDLARMAVRSVHDAMVRGQASPLYRAEVERAVRDVAAVVAWSFEQGGELAFAYGERSFGHRGGDWSALEIKSGNESVFVAGRIDRVDYRNDGTEARVIDYKSSAPPAWSLVGTRAFQPPLYASVIRRELGPLLVRRVRALYLETSRRPPKPLPVEKNQTMSRELVASSEANAAAVTLRVWRGDVAPRPAEAAVCSRCDARDICRRPAAMPIQDIDLELDGVP
jgi:ATP-dependent helicase/nuclease subunit B